MIMTQIVFVALWRLRLIFFSSVLWLRAFLAGFSLLCFTLRLCVLLCCVMSSLAFLLLSLLWFLVFLFTCCILPSISCGGRIMLTVSVMSSLGLFLWLRLLRPVQSATFVSSLKGSGHHIVSVIFKDWGANGVFGRVSEGSSYFHL